MKKKIRIVTKKACQPKRGAMTVFFLIISFLLSYPVAGIAADRLVIKNDSSVNTFTVQDNGNVYTSGKIGINEASPGSELTVTGTAFPVSNVRRTVSFTNATRGIATFELISTGDMVDTFGPTFGFRISDDTHTASKNIVAMQAARDGSDESGSFVILTADNGVLKSHFSVTSGGNVGVGTTEPTYKLHVIGQAYFSVPIMEGSSRTLKENIKLVNTEEAMAAFDQLNPVEFNYKVNKEETYLGFIAEDVPDIVSTNDRKAISTMDIVALLTKVVKEQKATMEELALKVERLEREVSSK